MSDLLQQAVASGQVSSAQIEAHRAAGGLGKSVALQMPPLPDHDRSWVNGKDEKGNLAYGVAHSDASLQNYAQAYAELLRSELEEANDTLKFVERWANHHGAKPHMTAEQALGCIQHYPGIVAITRSYSNGKVPETRNPLAELEAARAALKFYADKEHFDILDEDAWDTCSGEPQNYRYDDACTAVVEDGAIARAALSNQTPTKEQSK